MPSRITVLILLAVSGCLPAVPADGATYYGNVVQVSTGDSLLLRTRSRTYRVRLAGLVAPDLAQSHGRQARAALARFVQGRKVRLVVLARDPDGRLAGRVYLDQLDINAELVRRGHVWVLADEADVALTQLEHEARQDGRGLWAQPAVEQ